MLDLDIQAQIQAIEEAYRKEAEKKKKAADQQRAVMEESLQADIQAIEAVYAQQQRDGKQRAAEREIQRQGALPQLPQAGAPLVPAHNQNQMPFRFVPKKLDKDTIQYLLVDNLDRPIMFSTALQMLKQNPKFREAFINTLRDNPFSAYLWECCPVNAQTVSTTQFEYVLINDPGLIGNADITPFAQHLNRQGPMATHFMSTGGKGGDTELICPNRYEVPGKSTNYKSLGPFSRTGRREQQHNLWSMFGDRGAIAITRNGLATTRLGTHGHGVGWLHLRADSRLKHTKHLPYRKDVIVGVKAGP